MRDPGETCDRYTPCMRRPGFILLIALLALAPGCGDGAAGTESAAPLTPAHASVGPAPQDATQKRSGAAGRAEGSTTAPAGAPATSRSATQAEVRSHPNILFILADDQAARTLGVDGNPHIRTPNIDRLAAEGTYFTRCYVPLPQCAPSRAALLTGRYPHAIGAMSNIQKALPPDVVTLAHALKRAGYRCGMIGKWHQGDPLKPQAGFEDFWCTRDKDASGWNDKHTNSVLVVNGERRRHEGWLDDALTDYALRFIDADDGRPFFLWLAFFAPHEPFTPPSDPRFAYDPQDVPLPESIRDDLSGKPPQQRQSVCHRWYRQLGEGRLRQQIAAYYSMISALDANVGRLVEHLGSRGLERDTLVVYLSDNGWLNGEHQLRSKGPMLYEELVRMPLILRQPGVVPAGRKVAALVSSLDLYPSLAARAGAPPPQPLDGLDLWPLVVGGARQLRDAVFLEFLEKGSTGDVEPMLGVVTRTHKYTRYLHGGDEELYDLTADSLEMRNLAASPEASAALVQHRELVDDFAKSIREPFWKRE